jgi:hypothetical protein
MADMNIAGSTDPMSSGSTNYVRAGQANANGGAQDKSKIVKDYVKDMQFYRSSASQKEYRSGDMREALMRGFDSSLRELSDEALDKSSMKLILSEAFKTAKVFYVAGVGYPRDDAIRSVAESMVKAGLFNELLQETDKCRLVSPMETTKLPPATKVYIITSASSALSKTDMGKDEKIANFKEIIKTAFMLPESFDSQYWNPGYGSYNGSSGWDYSHATRQEVLEIVRDNMNESGLSQDDIKQAFIQAAKEKITQNQK